MLLSRWYSNDLKGSSCLFKLKMEGRGGVTEVSTDWNICITVVVRGGSKATFDCKTSTEYDTVVLPEILHIL